MSRATAGADDDTPAGASFFRELARPKVNLTLRVLGRRPDGYHALASLVVFARQPADVVILETGAPIEVHATGPGASAILGENLLAATLRRLAATEPRLLLGRVTLEKHLPVAAGIGGGSADAAALIRAVLGANPEFATSLPWLDIAKSIGADVPVCVPGRPALMWGIGERMAPVALPSLPALIVNPFVPVPADKTAQVFRRLGAAQLAADPPDPPIPGPFGSIADVVAYMRQHANDLTRPAREVVPAIDDVLETIEALDGCLIARLSGGGPTCFGIFASGTAARAAATIVRARHPSWWVAATVLE